MKNPHDKIFRKALDKKENAIQIINNFLNKEEIINTSEIEKYNSSYISERLKNSEADVVYKIKNENVFFLIEHQTKIDYSMPYRILKYELEIMDSVIIDTKENYKNKEYKYPVVIPIILYTGNRKWNAELDLKRAQLKWNKYKGTELSKYNVLDVNDISNEKLLKEPSIISKLMLIEKSKTEEEFIENLNKILKEFKIKRTIYSKEEKDFFIIATKVIIKNQFKKDFAKEILRNIEMEEESLMMQVIETLNKEREKLREDSIKRGKIEGKIEDIKNMLKEKLPIELISKITGMTEKEIKSIK